MMSRGVFLLEKSERDEWRLRLVWIWGELKLMSPLTDSDGLVLKCYLWVTSLLLHSSHVWARAVSPSVYISARYSHVPVLRLCFCLHRSFISYLCFLDLDSKLTVLISKSKQKHHKVESIIRAATISPFIDLSIDRKMPGWFGDFGDFVIFIEHHHQVKNRNFGLWPNTLRISEIVFSLSCHCCWG